jgi:tetratricopeptide (TPR) repeat protein
VAKAAKTGKKKTARRKDPAATKTPVRAVESPVLKAPETENEQLQLFEKAMEAFRAADFKTAIERFEVAAKGPDGPMRHRAAVHIRICRQRIGSDTVNLKTVDDHYNYAIRLMNDRRLDEATEHLEKALQLAKTPPAHVHYALAVVAALQEDAPAGFERLRQAIEIDPRQRWIARRDSDLTTLTGFPPIAELLAGDGSTGPDS